MSIKMTKENKNLRQRNQRNRRRERAQRMQQQRQCLTQGQNYNGTTRMSDAESSEDIPRQKCLRPPRLYHRKKRNKEPIFEENIINEFSILSFKCFEDLQKVAKYIEEKGCFPDPVDNFRQMTDNNRCKNAKLKNEKKKFFKIDKCFYDICHKSNKQSVGLNGIISRSKENLQTLLTDESSVTSSERGYICDGESEDDKASDSGFNSELFAPGKRDYSSPDVPPKISDDMSTEESYVSLKSVSSTVVNNSIPTSVSYAFTSTHTTCSIVYSSASFNNCIDATLAQNNAGSVSQTLPTYSFAGNGSTPSTVSLCSSLPALHKPYLTTSPSTVISNNSLQSMSPTNNSSILNLAKDKSETTSVKHEINGIDESCGIYSGNKHMYSSAKNLLLWNNNRFDLPYAINSQIVNENFKKSHCTSHNVLPINGALVSTAGNNGIVSLMSSSSSSIPISNLNHDNYNTINSLNRNHVTTHNAFPIELNGTSSVSAFPKHFSLSNLTPSLSINMRTNLQSPPHAYQHCSIASSFPSHLQQGNLFPSPLHPLSLPSSMPFASDAHSPGSVFFRRPLDNQFLSSAPERFCSSLLRSDLTGQHNPLLSTLGTSSPLLSPLLPKLGGVDSSFYRPTVNSSFPAMTSLVQPNTSVSSTPSFVTPNHLNHFLSKKHGRWNAMHVRIAWEIYRTQQKHYADATAGKLPLGQSSILCMSRLPETPISSLYEGNSLSSHRLHFDPPPSTLFPPTLGQSDIKLWSPFSSSIPWSPLPTSVSRFPAINNSNLPALAAGFFGRERELLGLSCASNDPWLRFSSNFLNQWSNKSDTYTLDKDRRTDIKAVERDREIRLKELGRQKERYLMKQSGEEKRERERLRDGDTCPNDVDMWGTNRNITRESLNMNALHSQQNDSYERFRFPISPYIDPFNSKISFFPTSPSSYFSSHLVSNNPFPTKLASGFFHSSGIPPPLIPASHNIILTPPPICSLDLSSDTKKEQSQSR